MGFDKAGLALPGGMTCAQRLGGLLVHRTRPSVEVGSGASGLACIPDDRPGEGPLAALATAGRHLEGLGHDGPVLVLSCDLPRLGAGLVSLLAGWPGPGSGSGSAGTTGKPGPARDTSVVPVTGGRAQPLLARYSPAAMKALPGLVAGGERSLRGLMAVGPVHWLSEAEWRPVASAEELADVDTPEDVAALGLGPCPVTDYR